jgi:hypothetical protein
MAKLVSLFDEKKTVTLTPNTPSDKKQDSGIKWQSFAVHERKPF